MDNVRDRFFTLRDDIRGNNTSDLSLVAAILTLAEVLNEEKSNVSGNS